MHGLDFVVTAVFFAWLMVWIFHCIQQMNDIHGLDVRLKTLEKTLEKLLAKDKTAKECADDEQ